MSITKGEWKRVGDGSLVVQIDDMGASTICEMNDLEDMVGNAQLISAAPDLLEACERAEKYLTKLHLALGRCHADGILAKEKLQQAITKAKEEV